VSDPVLACAWRIVLVASGTEGIAPADTEYRRRDCERLSPADQAAAIRAAKELFSKIYRRELILPADFFGGNRPLAVQPFPRLRSIRLQ